MSPDKSSKNIWAKDYLRKMASYKGTKFVLTDRAHAHNVSSCQNGGFTSLKSQC